jgi:tryptophanyl-tRNA synthetase
MNAFTGGQPTAKEQREKGANPEVCKVCEMLRFHYPDQKRFEKQIEDYASGKILDRENKEFTADFVCDFLEKHQQKFSEKLPLAKEIVYGK